VESGQFLPSKKWKNDCVNLDPRAR
jgi:hypothetical protein